MPVTINDNFTVVRNTSGRERFFAYVGDLGVNLANGEEYSVRGDLRQTLAGTDRRQHWDSLSADLAAGIISIRSTPVSIVRDETTGASKAIVANSGSLALVDPAWGQLDSYSGGI